MTVVSPSPYSSSAQLKKPFPTRMEVGASLGRGGVLGSLLEPGSWRSRSEVDEAEREGEEEDGDRSWFARRDSSGSTA